MPALLALYYWYIQTYINYTNIAWGSTCRINLKKINSQQKHASHIIFNKNKFAHTRETFQEQKILNIYQLSILSNIVFKFCKPSHPYPTNFSAHSFLVPTLKMKKVGKEFLLEACYFGTTFWQQQKKPKKVFQNSGLL